MNMKSILAASVSAIALVGIAAPSYAANDLDALYAAAKAEGQLTTIALPHNWCGYDKVIDGFKAKYPGITINELNPDAGSGDEIEAIKANQGNTGPQAPDVIDVGLSFGPSSKDAKLIQPYKVSTWDSIPDSAKDADGYWYGDYYGVLAFLVNDDLVATPPTSWADLKKPDYANQFALSGDPRASNQAIQAVYAAGLASGGTAGADAGTKGLAYFADLNKAGNFVPVIGKAATVAQGTSPIVAAWDSKYAYNRQRPSELDSSLSTAVANPMSPSYPCEHAVTAGAASGAASSARIGRRRAATASS